MEEDINTGIRTVRDPSWAARVLEDLAAAEADRRAGYKGRTMKEVLADMERIIAEAEAAQARRSL